MASASPLTGMTGFARVEGLLPHARWAIEARSVNGRGLDVRIKYPPGLDSLEPIAREEAASRFKRGSIQLSVQVSGSEEQAPRLEIDQELVARLLEAAAPLVARGQVQPPSWDGLLQVRGVLRMETADDEQARAQLASALADGVRAALDGLAQARVREGAMLQAVLLGHVETLDQLVARAQPLALEAPARLQQTISARLANLGELGIDPQRLAQEVALLASKADVREELDRLLAHLQEARTLLGAQPGAVGRRLDFLAQELHRESNTYGAKSSDIVSTRIAIDLKSTVEQFKEQVQNVE